MKTINDLYKYASTHSIKLLSEYSQTWWWNYLENATKYDKVFRRLYYSFYYFMQSQDETVDEVVTNFVEDVYNILLVHDKEFSELWRVKVLSSDAYSITDNYDMTEELTKYTGETLGSRQDSETNNIGQQTGSNVNKKAPYDSENFYNAESVDMTSGSRQDSRNTTFGTQTNTGSENYTLHRSGNIGVMTSTDVMRSHVKFWTDFDFYHYVFGVIARELLTVGDGGTYHDNYDR